MSSPLPRYQSIVLGQRILAEGLLELSFERCGLTFQSGDEIQIHGATATHDRTYSILSGEADPDLQVLYRVIPDGGLTPQLARLKTGDPIVFAGPFGHFHLRDPQRPAVFVATGTGIAPAVSFARTYPGVELHLLHGVRVRQDLCYSERFAPERYHPCVSRESAPGTHHGRVTALFPTLEFPHNADYYLCGANDMIVEMIAILKARGVEDARISGEAYYWW